MRTSHYERGDPHHDFLDDEARAVIEAEFEHISNQKPSRTLIQAMKERMHWIKQRWRRF